MSQRYGKAGYQPQCLADRVNEARAAAKFGSIAKTGKTSQVFVPGHDAKLQEVFVRKVFKDGVNFLTAECRGTTIHGPDVHCPGNFHGICYHAMAAVVLLADAEGFDVSFTEWLESATALKRFGKSVTAIYSWQNKGVSPIYVAYQSRTQEVGNG